MITAFDTYVRINNKKIDLTAPYTVQRLLNSNKGRKAIARWLNTHGKSAGYEKVYSAVSACTGGSLNIVEPLVAAATIATCMLNPAMSFPQNGRHDYSAVCKTCHISDAIAIKYLQNTIEKKTVAIERVTGKREYPLKASLFKDLKELTFVNLGTKGAGVSKVSEVFETDDSTSGKVGTARLLFRNDKGMRLISEIGKYPPKGAEIVFGNKAYKMHKSGIEWNMRNVVSINGTSIDGNVFVAEYFVRKNSGSKKILEAENKKSIIKGIKERYASYKPAEIKKTRQDTESERIDTTGNKADNIVAAVKEKDNIRPDKTLETKGPLPANSRPEYAFYQLREPENIPGREIKEIKNTADNKVVVTEKQNSHEVTLYFGDLTVNHIFKGEGNRTIHEAFLKAYPKVSIMEIFNNVPLSEVKKNVSRYIRGVDGQLESNILMLANKELGAMFTNNTVRQLPSPDDPYVTGVKIYGEPDHFQYIYISLHFGPGKKQWVALNDDFLAKIVQSMPLPSYMAVGSK